MKIKFQIFNILVINFIFFSEILCQSHFNKFFEDKSLRIDYYHGGNYKSEFFVIDELIEEKYWAGNKNNLIYPFDYGKYQIVVKDFNTEEIIYSYNYSTLFSEWQTTEEAKRLDKIFHETVLIPFPKNKIKLEFYSRDSLNIFQLKHKISIDPSNPYIIKEQKNSFISKTILENGSPENKVDIVFIPEGYTFNDSIKLLNDANRFTEYLFNSSPFKENKDKFNINLVFAWSLESGTDNPPKNIWKNTILNSRFYTFYLDRYIMTTDNKVLRDIASNVPYDQIYILANTIEYGGGAIYNHYAVCVSDNKFSEYIFIHEFGHSFAFLADEYYDSEVAYENFYKLDVEPLESNITTLINFEKKWKNLIKENIPIPTPVSNEYKNEVGVFEGGGYSSKGIYRPQLDCTMKSISVDNFCLVCKNSIIQMINYYCNQD
jgi:hypothetical protein